MSGQFGSWEQLDCLGCGGQARVFKVRTDQGDVLAAKYLDLPPGEETAASAVTEAKLLVGLCHRNIVQFAATRFDPAVGQRLILFTEFIEGQTLRCIINGQPLEQAKIRTYSLQLAEALNYIHTRRPPVIHRDVNCNNVMIRPDDTLKLIDFGLSTCLQPLEDASSACGSTVNSTASSRHQLGTVGFLAPEILYRKEKLGVAQYSAQSDIWAFGCTVYQMATGQAPYYSSQPAVYIYRVVKQGAPQLPKAAYSEELRQFYHGCVCKDRRRRFTAGDLLQHNFLLYRPEELRELRQLVQDYQRQCAEQTQLHAREKQQAAERKRKRIASANAEATRERHRLQIRLAMAQKVAKKAAGKRRREAAQRARERARRSRMQSGTDEDVDLLATAAAEADEAATVEQLTRDLAAAMDTFRRDLLAVELRLSEQLLQLDTEEIAERAAQQLELDTKMLMLKSAEATAKFDKVS
uniref:Protein kinase domain-containing protein n=1 Tax=Macrostomum lignano TaxID=282301 RepID=A0A1I8GZP9_9PLAT